MYKCLNNVHYFEYLSIKIETWFRKNFQDFQPVSSISEEAIIELIFFEG